MKKLVSAILCLALCLSLLPLAVAEEAPTVISMMYSDNANYPLKEDWLVLQLIKEKCNVTFDFISIPESDYEVKRQTIFNSGELPDIVAKTQPTKEQITSGLLLPISQYIDQMPNYKAFTEKYGVDKYMDMFRQGDGEYYFLPIKATTAPLQEQQWLIRYDIFEKNNIAIPTTLDELADALLKLKELYPDSVGLTNRFTQGNLLRSLGQGFGIEAGWNLDQGVGYDREADNWYFTPTCDNYKAMLTYLNRLYTDGTLDPEWATLDTAVYEQYIVQGKTFVMMDWAQNKVRYNAAGVENDENYYVGPIYPLSGLDGNYALGTITPFTQYWCIAASAAEKPYFDKLLAFIDWCYTDEAEMLLTFGVEGETYEKNADGYYAFIDPNNIDYYAQYGVGNNCLDVRQNLDVILSTMKPSEAELFAKIAADGCYKMPNPSCPFNDEELEELNLNVPAVVDYANQCLLKFVDGSMSIENEWDTYVATMKDMGCERLAEIYNTAWARK